MGYSIERDDFRPLIRSPKHSPATTSNRSASATTSNLVGEETCALLAMHTPIDSAPCSFSTHLSFYSHLRSPNFVPFFIHLFHNSFGHAFPSQSPGSPCSLLHLILDSK
ncbi:hypothetical protein ACLOJK_013429 [Asimina triloba]